MKKTAMPASAQRMTGCGSRIQNTGVSPRMTSRKVPPPTPVIAARKMKPTRSSSLREAASRPVTAKTTMPT